MASAVAESIPPDSSTIASLMRVHYPGRCRPRDPFEDAALYDWEYRRRRDDVRFYRRLADERGGPILDLGCGTGRLMVPLLRAGHTVVGVDRAPAMLARARPASRRLAPRVRRRALLVRGDLRRSPVRAPRSRSPSPRSTPSSTSRPIASSRRLLRGRRARRCSPGGWFAFDTFAPDAAFLARARAAGASAPLGADAVSPPRRRGDAPSYSETLPARGRAADDDVPLPAGRRGAGGRAGPSGASTRPTACSTPPKSPALLARRRPHADRELGRLRRPPARRRRPSSTSTWPAVERRATPAARAGARPERRRKTRNKTTIVNCPVENGAKRRGYPLDRIMAPDTMARDFRQTF